MELTAITEIDIVIRLCLGFAAGGIIGFERSSRHQIAGLRTHILICLGATLLMLISTGLPRQFSFMKNGDPGRIAAQVVSGIGFLGAGAIIRLGNNIKGLTTAASLWLVAAVGMAIGAGMYIAAAAAETLALVTLILLDRLERKIFPVVRNKVLELHYTRGSKHDTGA
ncbi:MAG: MgtC/SapB family protein, partial [Treponema sp.]|nr:MgtC/SapB family protein [Treponema sp.]